MNTQDKINAIESIVIQCFSSGDGLDTTCATVAPAALQHGIAFGEIYPLVKAIGRKEGYVVELVDRKKNMEIDLFHLRFCKHTYKQMMSMVGFLAEEYGVPVNYALATVKACLTTQNLPVPTKPLLSGWKATALIMWQEYALLGETPDLQDIRKFLRLYGHNHSLYTQAYHELYTELVAIEVLDISTKETTNPPYQDNVRFKGGA